MYIGNYIYIRNILIYLLDEPWGGDLSLPLVRSLALIRCWV